MDLAIIPKPTGKSFILCIIHFTQARRRQNKVECRFVVVVVVVFALVFASRIH